MSSLKTEILAIYGSPRRKGNTALLLRKAVEGAREANADVEEIVLRDLKISPCLEIYGCKETGRCVIKDDFQPLYDKLVNCRGLMLASPIFFYTVSALTKAMMDRCQSLWVKRYWIEKTPFGKKEFAKKGLFISVGATKERDSLKGFNSRFAISLMPSTWNCGRPSFIGALILKGIS
jgi:multimeric flavodoxin WrbA